MYIAQPLYFLPGQAVPATERPITFASKIKVSGAANLGATAREGAIGFGSIKEHLSQVQVRNTRI